MLALHLGSVVKVNSNTNTGINIYTTCIIEEYGPTAIFYSSEDSLLYHMNK
jgi:hypothetical protein